MKMWCAYHNENTAVVNCNGCGKPLCRACDHRIKGFPFCQDCIVAGIELLQQMQSTNQRILTTNKNPSPYVSAILSLICPGLGTAYNGQMTKALIYFLIFTSLFQLAVITSSPIFVFGFIGMWVFSAIDSWRTAKMMKIGLRSKTAGDWLVNQIQNNPKIVGIILTVLGFTFLSHLIIPAKIFVKLILPITLIALGVYILTEHKSRRNILNDQSNYASTSFRTGEFEVRKFDDV
jgi:TM2 domain-containing membrane protein YozV